MTSGGKFALAGITAGTVMAGAPIACGAINAYMRKPIDKSGFLHLENGVPVTQSGKSVTLTGTEINNPALFCFKDGNRYFPDSAEEFADLEKRFGNYGAREIYGKAFESIFSKDDIKALKKEGVNCVRISLYKHLLFKNGNISKKEEPILDRLDNAIKLCKKAGIYVILTLNGYENNKNLFSGCKAGFDCRNEIIKLWLKVLNHYKNESAVAAVELLNGINPADDKESDLLVKFAKRAAKAIREINDEHIIICSGIPGKKQIKSKDSGLYIDNGTDCGLYCIPVPFKTKAQNSIHRVMPPEIDTAKHSFDEINEKIAAAYGKSK